MSSIAFYMPRLSTDDLTHLRTIAHDILCAGNLQLATWIITTGLHEMQRRISVIHSEDIAEACVPEIDVSDWPELARANTGGVLQGVAYGMRPTHPVCADFLEALSDAIWSPEAEAAR